MQKDIIAELMSKNDVDIKAEDAISGKVRKATAYFSDLKQYK